MILVSSDSELRSFFPNVFASAAGEPSFFEKLLPHLEAAEAWISRFLVDLDEFSELPEPVASPLKRLAVALALHAAAPQLDLALTANGFVTAGTPTAVPISAERMRRLMRSLAFSADSAISAALAHLHSVPEWCESPHGAFFAASLIQDPEAVTVVHAGAPSELPSELEAHPQFDRFLSMRQKALDLELIIAEEFISPELMAEWRRRKLSRSLRVADIPLVSAVTTQLFTALRGGCLNKRALASIVGDIRNAPEDFPEWHSSETSRLFNNHAFKNEKSAGGYFW